MRYTLKAQRSENGRHYTIPGGGIDMCDECWQRIGKPRLRPDRQENAYRAWRQRRRMDMMV